MATKTLQRNPHRLCVTAYMDLDLAAKVQTAIEGKQVERKRRAVKTGRFVKKEVSMRPKTIGDALVEIASKEYGTGKISKKARTWANEQYERNLAKRKIADASRTSSR